MSDKRCDDFFEMLLEGRGEISDDSGYIHSSLKQFLALVVYVVVYGPPSLHCAISVQQTRRQKKEQSLNVLLE